MKLVLVLFFGLVCSLFNGSCRADELTGMVEQLKKLQQSLLSVKRALGQVSEALEKQTKIENEAKQILSTQVFESMKIDFGKSWEKVAGLTPASMETKGRALIKNLSESATNPLVINALKKQFLRELKNNEKMEDFFLNEKALNYTNKVRNYFGFGEKTKEELAKKRKDVLKKRAEKNK